MTDGKEEEKGKRGEGRREGGSYLRGRGGEKR